MNASQLMKAVQFLRLHATFLGSGSHSPFLIHIDMLGPLSTSPEEQVKVTLSP